MANLRRFNCQEIAAELKTMGVESAQSKVGKFRVKPSTATVQQPQGKR